jgi:phosphatidylinositol alpha-1,6-mannosyltransferase
MSEPGESSVVLLVTRNFPPLLGGMENVNLRLLQALAAGHRVVLAGPRGSGGHAPEALDVAEAPVRPLWHFVLGTAWNAVRFARRYRPEVVLAGSGLAAPMAWLASRICGARFVVYLHGLDVIVRNRVYQAAWMPFIRSCDLALVNSRHTAGLAAAAGVAAERVAVLNPGTDVPPLRSWAASDFRERFALGDRPVLLSVGRLTRRKGLVEFVGEALPRILESAPGAVLVVIGEEAADALHTQSGSERQRIEAAARAAGVAEQVLFAGRCTEEQLADAYFGAQVHVFPVLEQEGDVEGFGMVALESAAHGLRTVAFAVGGVPDAVLSGTTGTLVGSGDYAAFAAAVVEMLDAPSSPEKIAASRAFAAGKDWSRFGKRLLALLGGEHAEA